MPRQPIPPIEALIEQLHGTDWTARCDAARLLGQSRDPHAVDSLLLALEDTDWRVQQAIVTLERIRSPQALPALPEIVLQSKHERSASCSWMPGLPLRSHSLGTERTAAWSTCCNRPGTRTALQKPVSYRNQFGM